MPKVTLFAGPSAWGLPPDLFATAGVDVRMPVRRGGIDALLSEQPEPGVVIVCDGVFQIAPAVSHAELCNAIDAGWEVWGVSSIGAIRAFELRHEGMRGFGDVYAMFERHDDFTDDELCLLHFPESPFFPVSEPLVNIRYALERLQSEFAISAGSVNVVIDALRALWFGDRSEARIRNIMVTDAGIDPTTIDKIFRWLATNRVKTMDLQRLLATRPWRDSAARRETP